MKWGVRRYQKKDGTITQAGKKRYHSSDKISDGKSEKTKKAIDIALSTYFGLSITYLGYIGARKIANLSPTSSNVIATTLGSIGGTKYYELSRARREAESKRNANNNR